MEEKELFEKAKLAKDLIKSPEYKLIEEFIDEGTKAIEKVLSRGLRDDLPEEGGKTWQEKYWDYVGEHRALNSLPKYLNKLIDKRDAIIKKGTTPEDTE